MWLNVTSLVGRATADPRQRETAGGTKYVTLRIAVPRGRSVTDFFTVELWGKLATAALDQVQRGVIVTIRADLKQQTWLSEGQRRERVVITARSLGIIRNPATHLGDIPEEADPVSDDGDDLATEVAA